MASIKEWPDGYLLSMDPRREDPLFYYMESGALANELKRLGFSQTPSVTPDSITWTRE